MTNHTTPLDLDDIETRTAHLYEYGQMDSQDGQNALDQLTDTDVPALLAEVRRLRDRVTELEAYAHGCDGEGCAIPHSSWCDAAKKTAAANNGCTCPQPWKGHPQPHAGYCWLVSPPRSEVEEMRRALAEIRTKTLCTEAEEIVAHCPDHGSRDGVWMSCHCPVADDMRRRAVSAVSGAADSRRA